MGLNNGQYLIQMKEVEEQDIKYTAYSDLADPGKISEEVHNEISKGFKAPIEDWKTHFETLTLLRSLNKYSPDKFMKDILPNNLKSVVMHVDGLRSKLSKEALTLLFEAVKHNKVQAVGKETLNLLVESLFKVSNSEKGFIKQEARLSIAQLEKTTHPQIYFQLAAITLNNNYNISELAILSLKRKLENHMIQASNENYGSFIKLVVGNLNAGRAVLEKTSKEILGLIRTSQTEKVFEEQIGKINLTKEEDKLFRSALAEKSGKEKGNFKDFLKQKGKEQQN